MGKRHVPRERSTVATSSDGETHPGLHQQSTHRPPQPTATSPTGRAAGPHNTGPAKWLCEQEGRCVRLLPRGFPEPGDRDRSLSPSRGTFTCAHACLLLSWHQPLWGEASTCPIPEQGAGVAHPQVNRPDSGEKNEGGGRSWPGGLAQALAPSSQPSAPVSSAFGQLSGRPRIRGV